MSEPGDPIPVIRRTTLMAVGGLFAGLALLVGTDLVMDARGEVEVVHLLVEALATGLAATGAAVFGWFWVAARRAELAVATREARAWEAEAARWRSEAESVLRGLSDAIAVQFSRWELTPAEREVGLLLLKGLSLKEIADVRATSERTARDQARAVYAKAGLAGRAELAAFFLEDLLLPPH